MYIGDTSDGSGLHHMVFEVVDNGRGIPTGLKMDDKHEPKRSAAEIGHPAWQRLKAEELLAQQLSQLQARRVRAAMRAPALAGPALQNTQCTLHDQLLERLPFRLTAAQQRVGLEVSADLQKNIPMHRLLQGDVVSAGESLA